MRKLMWFSVGVAVAAAIGIYTLQGNWYFLASGIAALVFAALLVLMQRYPKLRIATVFVFGCIIGFLWMSVFESAYLSVPRAADGKKISLTITATDYSRDTDYGTAVEGFAKLNGKTYKVNVYLPKEVRIQPGDRLTGRFELRSTLPGSKGENPYCCGTGVFLTAKMTRVPIFDSADKLPWFGYAALVRERIIGIIHSVFPEDASGFATALLIGDKQGIDYETDVSFKISGISHIIAVSGFHVTVLFALLHTVLCKNRWLSALIGIPVLFFFAAVVGFSASITRACLMHSLMIIALLFDRDYDPLTALGFAVLVMLAVNPWVITNVSFQLSVGCMIGILTLSEPMKLWIFERKIFAGLKGKKKKLAGGFVSSVAMTLGATVFVTPLCAYYFGTVSLVSVVTNLLTLWIISLIFYGIMIACLFGIVSLPLGTFMGQIVSWPIRYVLVISKLLAKFPLAAVYTDSVYIVIWLVFVYILLAINFFLKKKRVLQSACCAVIGLCIALTVSWTQPLWDECRVTVLDVGQGQCILLQSEGKTYMVDCGGDSDTDAANKAVSRLHSQGIRKLDGIILTHYDRDHAAGVAYLLGQLSVDAIFLPQCADTDGTMSSVDMSHFQNRFLISELTSISFGNTKITLIPSKSNLSDNEAGLCVLFQTENCDILITGDRSAAGERELMRQIKLPELEVLIVGHHGSKYSTSRMLLQQTSPQIAIISAGADNPYGHPAEDTLQRLLEAGCLIYRTDLHGTIIYRG